MGSAEEREQPAERRRREIQEATVGGVEGGGHIASHSHVQRWQIGSARTVPSVARTELQAVGSKLYIQYGGA